MKTTHGSGQMLLCAAEVQHTKALVPCSQGPGASLNDPAITVLVEAVPNPSEVNWDTLERDMATYKSSHWGHPLQIFPVTIVKVKSLGDNRQLETET